MAIIKCPRCDINFIREEDAYCNICKREMKGEAPKEELVDMCIECGENPAVPGDELCAFCLNDRKLAEAEAAVSDDSSDDIMPDPEAIELDIEIVPMQADELSEDIPDDERQEIHKELGFNDENPDSEGTDEDKDY